MHFACIVGLHVAVNDIKILNVAQSAFMLSLYCEQQ
jgi:hypothetical protein